MQYTPSFFLSLCSLLLTANFSFAQCNFLGEITNECNLSIERIDGQVFEIDNPPTNLEVGQNLRFSIQEIGASDDCQDISTVQLTCYSILDVGCSDFEQINLVEACDEIYNPVCGCDGVSYVNPCQAEKWNGIVNWTQGACNGLPIICMAHFQFAYIDNNTVVFYNNSEAYNDFQWNFGEGSIEYQGTNTAVVSFYTAEEEVCISVSNSDGCTDEFCLTISMDSPDELCSNTDCVWPGDSDGDGKANNYDLLNIGLGFGTIGPPRTDFPYEDDPIAWAPNYADNWDEDINLVDYKHLDCNGDGEINEDDLLAIYNNYTPDFDYVSYPVNNAPPVFIEFTTTEIIVDETTPEDILLEAKLYMGSTVYNVEDLHGFALSIIFPFDLVVPNSVDFIYNDASFFGPEDQTLAIEYDLADLGIGRFDISLSQQANGGVGGLGEIGTFSFVVSSDIIDGLSTPEIPFDVALDKIKMLDANGDELDFNIPSPMSSLTFINDGVANTPTIPIKEDLKVFPNPVKDQIFIQTEDFVIEQVIITNPEGKTVESLNFQQNQVTIDRNGLSKGVYFLQIRTNEFIETRRIIIQ